MEIIRQDKTADAIVYAKKYFSPFSDVYLKEIQQVMALLAFTSKTECKVYKKYFDQARWEALVEQFRTDNFSLNNLPHQPMLKISLQAGLSALKTPFCYQKDNKNINCPVCEEETFGKLAEKLPMSHHVNSCIVCRITGKIMNEDNPPMVLQNGNVYSREVLKF